MRRIIFQSILLLFAALILPIFFMKPSVSEPTPAPILTPAPTPETSASFDAELTFTALRGDQVVICTLYDYLPGTLAGEMPAVFESEALMAQAVAARTYILYCTGAPNPKHPEAAVCDDPACCKYYIAEDELSARWGDNFETYREKITSAVRDTDGQCLLYGGQPIQAVFHSSSFGHTESSGNLWNPLPYLVSVSSPETAGDVPNYITTVSIAAEDFRRTILADYPEAVLDGAPASWLGAVGTHESGRVAYVTIGGVLVSGAQLRRIFELRSSAFDLGFDPGGFFQFTVRGYGHGVGLSQYGANTMAKSGAVYEDILAHYYPGTVLSQLTPISA